MFLYPQDVSRLAKHLSLSVQEFVDSYCELIEIEFDDGSSAEYLVLQKEGESCVFLRDDGLCKVHVAKPIQCLQSPFTPEFLIIGEGLESFASICPGLGIGKLYPPEFIEVMLDRISEVTENYEEALQQTNGVADMLGIDTSKLPRRRMRGVVVEE